MRKRQREKERVRERQTEKERVRKRDRKSKFLSDVVQGLQNFSPL